MPHEYTICVDAFESWTCYPTGQICKFKPNPKFSSVYPDFTLDTKRAFITCEICFEKPDFACLFYFVRVRPKICYMKCLERLDNMAIQVRDSNRGMKSCSDRKNLLIDNKIG